MFAVVALQVSCLRLVSVSYFLHFSGSSATKTFTNSVPKRSIRNGPYLGRSLGSSRACFAEVVAEVMRAARLVRIPAVVLAAAVVRRVNPAGMILTNSYLVHWYIDCIFYRQWDALMNVLHYHYPRPNLLYSCHAPYFAI